jgi:hypothetical protein
LTAEPPARPAGSLFISCCFIWFKWSFFLLLKLGHWVSFCVLYACCFQLGLCSCLIEKHLDIFVKMVIVGGRKKMGKLSEKLTKSWRCALQFVSCKFAFFLLFVNLW